MRLETLKKHEKKKMPTRLLFSWFSASFWGFDEIQGTSKTALKPYKQALAGRTCWVKRCLDECN